MCAAADLGACPGQASLGTCCTAGCVDTVTLLSCRSNKNQTLLINLASNNTLLYILSTGPYWWLRRAGGLLSSHANPATKPC